MREKDRGVSKWGEKLTMRVLLVEHAQEIEESNSCELHNLLATHMYCSTSALSTPTGVLFN